MGKEGWEGRMPVRVVREGVNRSVLTWPYVKTEESESNKRVKFHEIEDNFILLYLATNKVGYLKRKSMIFWKELKNLPNFLELHSSLSSFDE